MRKFGFALALTALSLSATAAGAEQKERKFTASSPWLMDYAKDKCSLARNFTDGESTATMMLERYFPDRYLDLILVSDGVRSSRGAQAIIVTFGPGGARNEERELSTTELTDGRSFFMTRGISLIQPATSGQPSVENGAQVAEKEISAAGDVSVITLESAFKERIHLQTGSLAPPVKALQICVDDLMSTWGLDPETQRNLTRRAEPSSPREFVAKAFRLMKDTRTLPQFAHLRVMVDPRGKPGECILTGADGYDNVKAAVCSAARRHKFHSALDARGNPVASAFTTLFYFSPD